MRARCLRHAYNGLTKHGGVGPRSTVASVNAVTRIRYWASAVDVAVPVKIVVSVIAKEVVVATRAGGDTAHRVVVADDRAVVPCAAMDHVVAAVPRDDAALADEDTAVADQELIVSAATRNRVVATVL